MKMPDDPKSEEGVRLCILATMEYFVKKFNAEPIPTKELFQMYAEAESDEVWVRAVAAHYGVNLDDSAPED